MSVIGLSFYVLLLPLILVTAVGLLLGIWAGIAWHRRVKREAADILHPTETASPAPPPVPKRITETDSPRDAPPQSLGNVLRQERLKRNMTQEFVAESLNVSRQAVSKWENGTSDPSTGNLLALAKLYNVSAADLLNKITCE